MKPNIDFDIFLKGENIDLVVLTTEIVEQTNWYNWFNDEENTEFMQQHYFPNSKDLQLKYLRNEIGALICTSKQAKLNFLIDDITNYNDLIKTILKENNFKDFKVVELDYKNNILKNYLLNYTKTSNEIICNNLVLNFSVMLPTYLKNC